MSRLKLSGIVALLTDFGTRDHFVGVVKGRILQELKGPPYPQFIDITHEIPPQNILAGALKLRFSFRYFPSGTVFLAIVDPGVGTKRRALLIITEDHFFMGPDNGLFSLVLKESELIKVYEIMIEKVLRPPFSSTFHGRDLFAPAVALLLRGTPLEEWTKPVDRKDLVTLDVPNPEPIAGGYRLQVIDIDRFGNLITNLSQEMLERKDIRVLVNGKAIRLVRTYGEAEKGELVALFSSEGLLEIAVREGSARALFEENLPEILILYFSA